MSGPVAPAAPAAPAAPVSSRKLPASEQETVTASAVSAPVVSSAPLPPTESAAERIERAARRIAANSEQKGTAAQGGQPRPASGQTDAAQPKPPTPPATTAAPAAPTAPTASDPAHLAYLAHVDLTEKQGGVPQSSAGH